MQQFYPLPLFQKTSVMNEPSSNRSLIIPLGPKGERSGVTVGANFSRGDAASDVSKTEASTPRTVLLMAGAKYLFPSPTPLDWRRATLAPGSFMDYKIWARRVRRSGVARGVTSDMEPTVAPQQPKRTLWSRRETMRTGCSAETR